MANPIHIDVFVVDFKLDYSKGKTLGVKTRLLTNLSSTSLGVCCYTVQYVQVQKHDAPILFPENEIKS